jgi:hypothetical protein
MFSHNVMDVIVQTRDDLPVNSLIPALWSIIKFTNVFCKLVCLKIVVWFYN